MAITMDYVRKILPTRSVCDYQAIESTHGAVSPRILDRSRYPRRSSGRSLRGSSCHTVNSKQRGMIVTLTVVILLSIGLVLLLGPFEMARATWLMSQSK